MVRKMAMTVISIAVKIILIVAVVCLLFWGGKKGFEFGTSIFAQTTVEEAPGTDVSVVIKKDTSTMDIGKQLEKEGVIDDYRVFWILALLYEYELGEGTYSLNTSMTVEDILKVMHVEKTDE